MAGENTAGTDRGDLRAELCNWLELMEISGTRDIFLGSESDGIEWDDVLMSAAAVVEGAGPEGDTGVDAEPQGGSAGITLTGLLEELRSCTRCDLHKARTNTVFGEGDPSSRLMFVGEGPGRDEDLQGRPFVGRAGMLLTRIVEAMGLKRNDVYIANIVKCRPPGNRNPEPDEISECLPHLEKQIQIIKPLVICTLGNVATQTITGIRSGITTLRGRFYDYRGIRVMPTFHPAACLRNPASKKLVWQDIKQVMKELDLPIRGVMKNGPSKDRD
jgi:DNA polymerase